MTVYLDSDYKCHVTDDDDDKTYSGLLTDD